MNDGTPKEIKEGLKGHFSFETRGFSFSFLGKKGNDVINNNLIICFRKRIGSA